LIAPDGAEERTMEEKTRKADLAYRAYVKTYAVVRSGGTIQAGEVSKFVIGHGIEEEFIAVAVAVADGKQPRAMRAQTELASEIALLRDERPAEK
jgi:hypothetical protein